MGFISFLGRVLFASIFILSAWQMFNDFGVDGGPAAKELIPRFTAVQKNLTSNLGFRLPDIDVRHLVTTSIVFKGLGGLLFVFGSTFGAYLLVRLPRMDMEFHICGLNGRFLRINLFQNIFALHSVKPKDMYKYLHAFSWEVDQKERSPLILTYIVLLAQVKLLHLAFSTPVLYDFYKYDMSQPEFFRLLNVFVQCLALSGGLLFFMGMKNSIPREATQEEGF